MECKFISYVSRTAGTEYSACFTSSCGQRLYVVLFQIIYYDCYIHLMLTLNASINSTTWMCCIAYCQMTIPSTSLLFVHISFYMCIYSSTIIVILLNAFQCETLLRIIHSFLTFNIPSPFGLYKMINICIFPISKLIKSSTYFVFG